VLIIYDTAGDSTPSLVNALTNAGHTVTLSSGNELSYNGTNPSPVGFGAVIHLNGDTYSSQMPIAGQNALVSYVQGGGGFIHGEWNAYEIRNGRMTAMTNLTLTSRTSGAESPITVTTTASGAGHPVMAGVSSSWTLSGGYNIGPARGFSSEPSTTLATDASGSAAVVVRDYQGGRIVGFHHAGNYSNYTTLANANVQQLYINAVTWASGGVSNSPPVADAGGPYTVNQNQVLTMDGSGSTDPENSITSYEWDCTNDGSYDVSSASASGSTCTYGSAGSYTVGLRVTDAGGLTDTDTASVTVLNQLPTANAGGPYSGTKSNPISVDGSFSSDVDGSLVQWEWDCHSDGTYEYSSTAATGDDCTFATVGSFTITLRVTDNDGGQATDTATATVTNGPPNADAGGPYSGDEGVAVALDGSGSTDPGGAVVQWEWDCTDDGTYDVTSATATGSSCTYPDDDSYTVRLRVTDDDGATDTHTAAVTIANVAPIISVTGVPVGDEAASLTFFAVASDVAADPLAYAWDFGDGTTGTGANVNHTYADDGSYTVTLTVTDGDGGTATSTGTAVIANVAPTVVINGPTTSDEGDSLSFTATGSDASAADLLDLTYSWDWGDSSSSTGASPTHTYVDDGVWTITVTVDDQDGGVTTGSFTVTTANLDPSITSSAPLTADQGALYTYSVAVTDPGTSDVFSYALDALAPAGMTVSSSGLLEWTPTYAEALAGTADVTLTVSDDDGGTATESWTIVITVTDTDGDGMPDDWETANGFDPNDPSDGLLDPDADGLTNADEFGLGTDPSVFDGPGVVTLVSPVGGEEVATDLPDLVFDNAVDPQNDVLTYDVEVYSDFTLTTLVTSATGVAEDSSGQTTWTVDVSLTENATYYWQARANDPYVDGAWSSQASFFVNATNDAPELPVQVWPIGTEITGSLTPALLWSAATDVDDDAVTYDVEVWDELMSTLITSTTGVADSGGPDVTWTVDVPLTEDTIYAWTVRSVDEHGLDSGWATEALFLASESNGPPTGTVFTNPVDGDSLFTTAVVFAASEAVDPELTELEYDFEFDSVATFDSGDYQSATLPATGTGTVEWDISNDGLALEENATTYARVRAVDADGLSSTPDTISFFVRGDNDPPSVPVLLSPTDGTEGDGSPVLEVGEPVDPEGDALTVEFIVCRDVELTDTLTGLAGVELDGSGSVLWTVDVVLDGEVFWSVRAVDEDGAESDWATPWRYVVPAAGDDDDDDDAGDDDDDSTGTGCDCASSFVGGEASWLALLLALPLALVRRRR